MNGTGVIKSPRFPSNYPVDILCEWKLCVKQGSRITLRFTDFEVRTNECKLIVIHWRRGKNEMCIICIMHFACECVLMRFQQRE